jgi:citrate lyase subunit beta/citryl-CoA lyase
MEATAGYRGDTVRSDCFVRLELTGNRGIAIDLKSKVLSLYGNSIICLIKEILHEYGIGNASVYMEDSGALPFVISARMEAAIRKITGNKKKYHLPSVTSAHQLTSRDSLRRSRLYVPGNTPKLIINAGLYKSDGVILDLEDSVPAEKKEEARILVRNAFRNNNLMGSERMVRINQVPAGLDDLREMEGEAVDMVLIPKCESASQVTEVDRVITGWEDNGNGTAWLMPIIESAAGVFNAFSIASASPRVAALAIGLEDYTADIGAQRTSEGTESFFARSMVVNAARAAGIQPLDSVFPDFDNPGELYHTATIARKMGFEGMGCIHPGQIPVIHSAFDPAPEELEKAKIIVDAYEKALLEGRGVVSVGAKMIDPPVVKRAQRLLEHAARSGFTNSKEEKK